MTLRAVDSDNEFAAMDPDDLPFACNDELITTAVAATEFLDTKMSALAALTSI